MQNCLVPLKKQKVYLKKDFNPKISDFFFKKPKKSHFGWVFYSFLEWVFCGFYGLGFLCQP